VTKWQFLSWSNVVLGLWLIAAPFAMGYSAGHGAVAEDFLLGTGIAVLAMWRAIGADSAGMRGVSWTVALAGLWVAIAPFALGYSGVAGAAANEVTVGLLVSTFGTIRALAPVTAKAA
jgi:hypothetical protein